MNRGRRRNISKTKTSKKENNLHDFARINSALSTSEGKIYQVLSCFLGVGEPQSKNKIIRYKTF